MIAKPKCGRHRITGRICGGAVTMLRSFLGVTLLSLFSWFGVA